MNRRNPFDEIERFFDRMSSQFEDFDEWRSWETSWPGRLKVDIADHGEEFEVTADLPGYQKDDIEVELTEDRLRIAADRETDTEETEGHYVKRERSRQSVSRTVTLPEPVSESGVAATFNHGVLSVTLPKAGGGEEAHRIDID